MKNDDKKWLWLFLKIGGGVVALWTASWIAMSVWQPTGSWGTRGQFGDMFGAVNALFSGLAFAGVIVTVWMQREELKLQREELEATREELRGQKEQMALQNETLRKQQLEATFFHMLNLYNTQVNSIEEFEATGYKADVVYRRGRSLLTELWGKNRYRLSKMKSDSGLVRDHQAAITDFLGKLNAHLPLIVRPIFEMISFLETSGIEPKDQYARMIRAQLSSAEQQIVFYTCIHFETPRDFGILVKKHEILAGRPDGSVSEHEAYMALYNSL